MLCTVLIEANCIRLIPSRSALSKEGLGQLEGVNHYHSMMGNDLEIKGDLTITPKNTLPQFIILTCSQRHLRMVRTVCSCSMSAGRASL